MISKSMLSIYSRCPKLFEYVCIQGIEIEDTVEKSLGRIFHETVANAVYKFRQQNVELYTGNNIVNEWLSNYYNFERTQKDYEVLAVEVELTSEDEQLTGIIDRIDLHTNGKVRILEYKTGRSINLTQWRMELHFYKLLYDLCKPFDYEVGLLAVYNPRLNIVFEEQPNKKSMNSVISKIEKLKKDLQSGNFVKKFDDNRCANCEFYLECLEDVETDYVG